MLSVRGLSAGYSRRDVVHDVSLDVPRGHVVTVLGHNGAGKTTLLRAMWGLLPLSAGGVAVDGHTANSTPAAMLGAGVTYIPQAAELFPHLTVGECIRLAISARSRLGLPHLSPDEVMDRYPVLKGQRQQQCRTLSGGERQRLSIAMGFVSLPRYALIDEPSLGLAPQVVVEVFDHLRTLASEDNVGVLLVEQRATDAVAISDSVVVLSRGSVSYAGTKPDLMKAHSDLADIYLL